jgi:Alpha/beta hydrolase
MVSLAALRAWDPAAMEHAFDVLGAARGLLAELEHTLPAARIAEPEWQGVAAELARAGHDRVADGLRGLREDVEGLRPGVGAAVDAVARLRAELRAVEILAATRGFRVDDDGALRDIVPALIAAEQAERVAELMVLAGRVRTLLGRATEVDLAVRALLQRAQRARATRAPALSPAAVAAWWRGLPPSGRAEFLAEHPEEAGNLDGLPAVVRDAANRRGLAAALTDTAAERDRTAAELAALTDAIDHGRQGADQVPRRDALTARLDGLEARLDVLQRLQVRLRAGAPRPALLLGFRPEVGNGRAVVAVGNPDTAANVVTFVPGTGSRLSTINDEIARSDAMADAAELQSGSASTAVVAWDGYDAPQLLLPDAARVRYADDAEPLLRSFQDGLRATHGGPPSRNTVLGHSYGSTVVGHTARDGRLDADALVFVASPGVGVPEVGGLHRPAGTVYATTGPDDPIEITHAWWLGPADDALGADPSKPAFGAHVFRSAAHAGHSDYWNTGNVALRSIGRIVTGREPVP